MREENESASQPEFWRDEDSEDRLDIRKVMLRWGVVFALLLGGMFFALWWAKSAIEFSASRVDLTTPATYRVSGVVRNAATGQPIPFAEVEDDRAGRPPLFHTTADLYGEYTLLTIAEPHTIHITALGYQAVEQQVGRMWYRWFPRGTERLNVGLRPE
jgi:hypothetical protein